MAKIFTKTSKKWPVRFKVVQPSVKSHFVEIPFIPNQKAYFQTCIQLVKEEIKQRCIWTTYSKQ